MKTSLPVMLLGALFLGVVSAASGTELLGTFSGSNDLEIRLLVPASAGSTEERSDVSATREVFGSPEEELLQDLFEQARWDFHSDGSFQFLPKSAEGVVPDFYPLKGTLVRRGGRHEIRAVRKSPVGPIVSLDGVIRKTRDGYRLEAIVCRLLPFTQQMASIRQMLYPGKPSLPVVTPEHQVGGFPVPSLFHLTLEGSVDGRKLAPLPGVLLLSRAPEGSPRPLAVSLSSLSLLEEGTIRWEEPPIGTDPESYRLIIGDGKILIELTSPSQGLPSIFWSKLVQIFEDQMMPMFFLGDRGRLDLHLEGDQLKGEVQLSTTAGAGAVYRGVISGKLWKKDSPAFPSANLSPSLSEFFRFSDVTIADGTWRVEDVEGELVGSLSIHSGEGSSISGDLDSSTGARRLLGSREKNSLDLEEADGLGGRWLLRHVPGSDIFIGLEDRPEWEISRPVVARRILVEGSFPLVDAGTATSEEMSEHYVETVKLGMALGLSGRCGEARPHLEKIIASNQQTVAKWREDRFAHDVSVFILAGGYIAAEVLMRCDLEVGDYEGFLEHLRLSPESLRSMNAAEQAAFLARAQDLQVMLPVFQPLLAATERRFQDACWRRNRRLAAAEISPLVEAVASGGAQLESLGLELQKHSAALDEIVREVSERRLSYQEGIVRLSSQRAQVRDEVRRAFANLAIAGREVLAVRDPGLLEQRDRLWQIMAIPSEMEQQGLLPNLVSAFKFSLALRFSPGLAADERDLISAQMDSGMLLLLMDDVLGEDDFRLLGAPIARFSPGAVEAAKNLAARPELWRSRLRTDSGKIQALDRLLPFFGELILFFLEENREPQALAVSEIARSRALVDLLASKDEIRKGLEVFWHRAGDRALPSPTAVAPDDLDQLLDNVKSRGAHTVEYFLTNDRLVIFSVAPDRSVSAVSSPVDRKALGASIEELRRLLAGRGEADAGRTHELLRELHRLLIAPIPAERLPASPEAVLTIIPHQELFGVPFAALEDETGRPLIERFALTHGTSITTLGLMRQNRKERPPGQPPRLLALVDPAPLPKTPAGQTLAPLSSIAAQFGSIANFYAEKDRLVLTGPRATEAALLAKAADADVLQLVTHAELVENDPLSSYIALAAGRGSADGYLRVPEIFRLSVPADLVILWACETGRGGISADGIEGLSRGFIWAGATSLILSLWEIPEDDSFIQMYGFHDFWLRQGLPKARALQQAQVEYSRLYPDQPGLWAGLVLYGEAD